MTNPSTIIHETLPVMERFYTIQGEGAHQGRAAYFIRLGGCDVGCVWCDVKESWDATRHPLLNIDDLLLNVEKEIDRQSSDVKREVDSHLTPHISPIAVITGGEPLLHDL